MATFHRNIVKRLLGTISLKNHFSKYTFIIPMSHIMFNMEMNRKWSQRCHRSRLLSYVILLTIMTRFYQISTILYLLSFTETLSLYIYIYMKTFEKKKMN